MINDVKKNLSLFILILINFLFLLKYSSRFSEYFFYISLFIVLLQYIIIFYATKFIKLKNKFFINPIIFILFFSFLLLLISFKVPIETLKIDRWSIIDSFWNNYFSNQYVYEAKSFDNNNPGPMPFYFIIFLPFYFLKEYSYITVIGILIFLLLLKKNQFNHKILFVFFIIISTSFFISYEVLARSNIFFNSILVLISIYSLLSSNFKLKSILKLGVITGLCLSTRNIFIIPFALTFLYLLFSGKISLFKLSKLAIISIVTFLLTFLPFIINHIEKFLIINPFIIQSSFLMPKQLSYLCIILSLFGLFFIKRKDDLYFLSGIGLFLTITVYAIYKVIIHGFYSSFIESRIDITYFIFCVPFFIFYYLKSLSDFKNFDV